MRREERIGGPGSEREVSKEERRVTEEVERCSEGRSASMPKRNESDFEKVSNSLVCPSLHTDQLLYTT